MIKIYLKLETNNDMKEDKFYENISVLCPIQQYEDQVI